MDSEQQMIVEKLNGKTASNSMLLIQRLLKEEESLMVDIPALVLIT
jgi:hypothetical protein